jgi:hypothetical protein
VQQIDCHGKQRSQSLGKFLISDNSVYLISERVIRL